MLKSLSVKDFKALAHLETSQLMARHEGTLKFSKTKPNVIVGPNGAGKSALLDTLALRFLASQTGESSLDNKYLLGRDAEPYWSSADRWGHQYTFLQGLTVATDNAPAVYYRPSHIPGNELGISHALMCGYEKEARVYAELTEDKSSGQKSQALLANLLAALDGSKLPSAYNLHDWRYGLEPKDLRTKREWTGPWEYQAEVLKALFAKVDGGVPLVLMDEPEQSLDAKAELQLWKAISEADCSRMQVVVATHSLYPLLHPKRFNIIEAADGYVQDVLALMA